MREHEAKAMRLEKLARMLLNTPQQAFYLYDYTQRKFLLGEEHVSGLYGYKAGEVEKLRGQWQGLVHPDDVTEFKETRWRVMESGSDEVQTLRFRIRRKQGSYEWVQVYMRPFERDAQGRVTQEAGMAIIITPLVEAEQALRESQIRSHSLFQSSAAAVLFFDSKLHIQDANPAMCRLLGYDKKALLRLGVLDITAPGARTGMSRLLRQLKGEQKAASIVDSTLERKNGSRVEVLVASACQSDEKGKFLQGRLLLLDITDRQQAQEQWRREAELNKVMIDHAPVAIGLLDSAGRVLRVNAAAEKLSGFKSKEMQGRQVWKLPILGRDEVGPSRNRFDSLLKGNAKSVSACIPMQNRNGQTYYMDLETTAVHRPDGGIDYLISTGVDVTEQRKLEAEVIRVAEQEHIRIGHDLHDGVGQTLTGIAALVDALAEGLEGEKKKDAERIHALVKTAISETRRLSHGLSPAAVKNRGLACGLVLIAETVQKNFRRECSHQIDEPAPKVNQEAEIHLFRIAQEAINNAIRHGGATKMHISLRRKSTTQGIMEIRDNGRGFPSGKSAVPNEGIGLRVMEHRAHLINGDLKIQASKGKGVRVVCLFPLANP